MQSLFLPKTENEDLNVLCLGAHCDDIEIGCGATLLKLLKCRPGVNVHWQVFTSTPARKEEAIRGANSICENARSLEINILDHRDGYLPYDGELIKDAFEQLKTVAAPDLIFTHYRHDRHQDHRQISEFTWNTFRNHMIWEYEIPKWDGDLGSPNTFVPIEDNIARTKIDVLQKTYNSQNDKRWFTDDLFLSLMRMRGMECNSETNLAEAFYTRKTVIELSP